MRTLLDTSVVIGGLPAGLSGDVAVSVVTLAELHFGVLRASDDVERSARLWRLAVVEREFDPLPVDALVAAAYGRLAALVAREGRNPRARTLDLLIAATAVANDAVLATRNPGDLRGLEGVLDVVGV